MMKDLLLKNSVLKLFSLLLAVAVWYFVNITVNPTVIRTFQVPLRILNESDKIRVKGAPARVDLRVSGRRLDLLKAFRGPLVPFEVFVEADGLVANTYRKKVHYKKFVDTDLRVVRVIPPQVDFTLVKMEEKELHVEYSLLGSPAPKHVRGEPDIVPEVVRVYGPREKLATLIHASVTLDATGAREDIVRDLRVRLLDKNLEEIGGIASQPDVVRVRVAILPWIKKEVPLEVPVTGDVQRGYRLKKISTKPELISFEAPPPVAGEITAINLGPVDISAFKEKLNVERMAIPPPAREMIIHDPAEVEVRVEMETITVTREIMDRPVTVNGPGDDFAAASAPESLSVILSGPMVVLDNLDESAVTPEVEVPPAAGIYYRVPRWKLPDEVVVLEGAGKTIEITVKQPVDVEDEDAAADEKDGE